jgi:hypothetical protein
LLCLLNFENTLKTVEVVENMGFDCIVVFVDNFVLYFVVVVEAEN